MNQLSHPNGLRFRKMHGLGNDFVVLDSRGQGQITTPKLARALGDRNRGVGFDQLAEIRDADGADIALDFWNADGSRAGACGNASRCVADLVMGQLQRQTLTMKTARGLLYARKADNGLISVNMGQPQRDWAEIPVAMPLDPAHLPLPGDPVGVGMGNPHCIFFVDDADAVDVAGLGPKVEYNPLFPQKTNVEFASLVAKDHLRMRVWERGAGITLACGSGACATAVASHIRGLTGKSVVIDVDGGQLDIDWRDDGVWMTGPVAYVFEGNLTPEYLAENA